MKEPCLQEGDGKESEKESEESEFELTEADLDEIGPESGIDESVIESARDWMQGDREAWAEMCYQIVKNHVRNTRDNRSGSSGDADGAQLAGGNAETTGEKERPERGGDNGVDRADGGEDVAGGGESRSDSSGSSGTVAGAGSNEGMEVAASGVGTNDSGSGNAGRGGRAGGKRGNVRKSGGKKGGKRDTAADGGSASEAENLEQGGIKGVSISEREQAAQDMIDDAIAGIKDILKNPTMNRPGQLNDVTTLLAGLGVNAVRFLGYTAKLGCGLVIRGYYKYARWQAQMHKTFDPILAANSDLTDEQVVEFIRSAWDMKMSFRGERKKISEWAAELEAESLRELAQKSIAEKRKLQEAAEGTEIKVCDLDNIRETLPFLLPAQHEDVEKAEVQFFKPEHSDREHGYGKGYLFTNGTGTGKTYTGLGIAKRFIKQGKGRILIVTVNDTKINDWINDAKNLGIEAMQLADTKSKGEGVVVTQYANMRQNYALLEDQFDLIIYDESHKLMENQEGTVGSTAEMHHMIAARDAETVIRKHLETNELGKNLRETQEDIKRLNDILNIILKPASLVTNGERELYESSGFRTEAEVREALKEAGRKAEALEKELDVATESAMADEGQRKAAEEESRKTNVVFLSATPFNTPSSLDYVEGYIFSYGEKKEGADRRTTRNNFLRQNFGKSYRRNRQGNMTRMSESQIADPEAVEEQEIAFSNRLQNELHTMSRRMLDSAWDYSRTFPMFDMPEAKMVNAAMSEIAGGPLEEFFKKTLLDYNYSTAFWEIIKTGFVIPRIREHIALGRKVVVFHRRKGSTQDIYCPFATGLKEAMQSKSDSAKMAAMAFAQKYAPLLKWESELDYTYPQDRILQEFVTEEERAEYEKEAAEWNKKRISAESAGKRVPPRPKLKSKRVGIFNGDQTEKEKKMAVEAFNSSESGQDIIVVQVQSGKEGISLHDTDGKHQRVMISLALPQSPIEFIQAEGRIYRVGNQSDAIFEYPLLGIDRELFDFGLKINGRSQTSENLAMGDKSRGLKESITRGALGSTPTPVTKEQGKGGKMLDSRNTQTATGFDHAMSNWKEWRDNEAEKPYDERSIPDPLGFKLMEWAGAERVETVLVPYAGEGSAARYVPASTKLIALESESGKLARLAALMAGGGRKILGETFMSEKANDKGEFSTVNKADVVVIKTKTGSVRVGFTTEKRSVREVRKALQHTEDSGRVVAIVPTEDVKGVNGVLKMLEERRVQDGCVARNVINLPANVFGIETSVVIIDKNMEPGIAANNAAAGLNTQDATAGKTAEESISQLREMSVEKREVDRIAKAVKRVKRVLSYFNNNCKLVSTTRWRGSSEKMARVSREGVNVHFTKYLVPVSVNTNSRYNGITIEFSALGRRDYLESIAKQWAACREQSEMSADDFKEYYGASYGKQSEEAQDALREVCNLIEAATGKTATQLSNIAEGKVENEIKREMTLAEFKDVYKTFDSGSEELDALAERVFAVAERIEGLTFKMADGGVFDGHNVMAHYAPAKNAIELNSDVFNSPRVTDAQKAQCVLHETIHAVTCWAMARYKAASAEERKEMGALAEACADIEQVFKSINNDTFRAELQAKSRRGDNETYGLTNEYEMLAEMANPAFRLALKGKRLWKQLVNGIKKLFGIDVLETGEEGTTAYEVLNRAINTILDNFDPAAYAEYQSNPLHSEVHEMRSLFDEETRNEPMWVQRSLFEEDNRPMAGMTQQEREEAAEKQRRVDMANESVDEFTDQTWGIYNRYRLFAKEKPELTDELIERMDTELMDEAERLRGHLEEYYLAEGNSSEDARRMSRDMTSRVIAETTLRLDAEHRMAIGAARLERAEEKIEDGAQAMVTAGGEVVTFRSASNGTREVSPLRKLEPGEYTHVERKFTETQEFGFTGKDKIESLDDVAYIFRSLEDYSIENSFVLLVKDGRPTIVHLGMGGPSWAPADLSAVRGAIDAFGMDEIYFVHNHPSGGLTPSLQDVQIASKIEQLAGVDVCEGVIIDVTSGRYSNFTTEFSQGDYTELQLEGNNGVGNTPRPVLRFNKSERSEDVQHVESLPIIRSSKDVATFVSGKRLGTESKISYLLLSRSNAIIGNLHTAFTEYGGNIEAMAEEMVQMGTRHGATSVIPYGNVSFGDKEMRQFRAAIKKASGESIQVLDALVIDSRVGNEGYVSAMDTGMVFESESEYGEIYYRIKKEDEIGSRFDSDLERYERGELPVGYRFELGMPSPELRSAGFPELPITMRQSLLKLKSGMGRHPFAAPELKGLVKALQKPIAVFRYSKENIRNVIVGLTHGDKHFLVGVTLNYNAGGVEINSISGLFPKESHEWLKWIQDGKAIRIDQKGKVLALIDSLRMNPAEAERIGLNLDEVTNIVNSFENPTIEGSKRFEGMRSEHKALTKSGRKRACVEKIAARLHLDNVDIIEDASGLNGRRAKAKGWYNRQTGRITIVLSNNTSAEDVERTLLHEAVAHYGLRRMFGKAFNTFLDNVYESASESIRRKIAEIAARNGWDFRTATEEYLASLAEETNFEEARQEAGWWSSVKRLFKEMLASLGMEGFGKRGVKLGDNELRYILWASYENLKGSNDYVSMARDAAKREELNIEAESENEIEKGDLFRDGDFSPRDKAIARDAYNRMCASGGFQFREATQDSMAGLHALYQAILGNKMRIEEVAGFENAYLYENRMSSTNAGEQYEYFIRYMRPLIQAIGKITGKSRHARHALTDYIMAKHGLERNAKMRAEAATNGEDTNRDFAGLCGLTGETDWQQAEDIAQQMVDDYESDHDTTELWEKINAATKATLEKLYFSGVMSQETYEKVRDMYEYYIPLRGWDETTSDEVYGYLTSHDGPLRGNIMKSAHGRKSKANDPIATIAMMADAAIQQGNRNVMKQRFLNFVLNHPSDAVSIKDLWFAHDDATDTWVPQFADLTPDMTAEEVEAEVEKFDARMEALAQAEPDKYKRGREASNIPYKVVKNNLKEHQVLIKRAGRTYVVTINGNPRAAQALNGLTNPDVEQGGVIGNMLKLGEYVNRQLSAFYTTRNPDFVVGNFFRDMLYSNCMAWVKENPRYALRFHKNFARVNPITMRKLLGKWTNGKLDRSNPLEDMFYQFMRNGGETGYTSVKDIEAHKKTVSDELKKQASVGRKAWSALGMQLELLNRSVENCARFAAFVTSREFGRSIDRSIYDAKEVSVNFNKKGSGGKMVNAVGQTWQGKLGSYLGGGGRIAFVFWNAGIQGLTNFGRAGCRHPEKAMAGTAALFALGYVIPIMAHMLGGGDGDDDDKNAYYNLPEYVRRSNICFKAGDQWITIPLPIEYRSIYGLGELAYGVISGNERYSDRELAYHTASQVSQILPLDMLEGGGGVNAFIPSAAKPFTEAYIMNKGWTGLPVYKDTPFNKDDPEWTKTYASADQHMVAFSRWLNEVSGGDDYKKGAIDINPAKIEYMLNGTFGGLVTFPNKVKKSMETAFGDREFEWRNMPIANRVVKSGDERTANRKLQNEYFKYKEEYERTGKLIRKYENAKDQGIIEYAQKVAFMHNSDEYLRWQIFDDYKPEIDAIREQLAEATDANEVKKSEAKLYTVMRELVDALHNPEEYIKSVESKKIYVG